MDAEAETIVMTILADIRETYAESERSWSKTMGKKRKKISTEQAAFDERTRMINEYLERRRREIEAKKAGHAKS